MPVCGIEINRHFIAINCEILFAVPGIGLTQTADWLTSLSVYVDISLSISAVLLVDAAWTAANHINTAVERAVVILSEFFSEIWAVRLHILPYSNRPWTRIRVRKACRPSDPKLK